MEDVIILFHIVLLAIFLNTIFYYFRGLHIDSIVYMDKKWFVVFQSYDIYFNLTLKEECTRKIINRWKEFKKVGKFLGELNNATREGALNIMEKV